MSTFVAIYPNAFTSDGVSYGGPAVKNYIESVLNMPYEYTPGGMLIVDTTNAGGEITASSSVLVPNVPNPLEISSEKAEKRPFSYWRLQPDPQNSYVMTIEDRTLEVFQGEHGLVGLFFGKERARIHWPGCDPKDFDLLAHIMISTAPSWEKPHPQPWMRRRSE